MTLFIHYILKYMRKFKYYLLNTTDIIVFIMGVIMVNSFCDKEDTCTKLKEMQLKTSKDI